MRTCVSCGKMLVYGYCRNPECIGYIPYANDLEAALGRISERDIDGLIAWRNACKQGIIMAEKALEEAKQRRNGDSE